MKAISRKRCTKKELREQLFLFEVLPYDLDDAVLGGVGVEVEEVLNLGALGKFLRNAFQCHCARKSFRVEILIGILERTKGFGTEVLGMATDGNGVEAAHDEVFNAHGEHVGRCVLTELGTAANHCEGADVGELE